MVSWLNIMQPGGMVIVGLVAIAYLYARKRTDLQYFLYGGILWALAIGIKVIMDYTITQPFISYTETLLDVTGIIIVVSLYAGLRTGVLENLIPYLAFKKIPRSPLTFDKVLAIGIGFGAAEAIVLGSYNFYYLFGSLQELDSMALLSPISLDQQTLINVAIPSFERLFALFAHAFAVVLVYYSVKGNRLWLLALAFIYKSLLDGMLLPIEYYSGSAFIWVIEGYIALLGLLGLVGLWWLKKAYGKDVVTLSAISIPAE